MGKISVFYTEDAWIKPEDVQGANISLARQVTGQVTGASSSRRRSRDGLSVVSEDSDFYSRYETREILGDGLSSVVRLCVNKETQEEFAVKIIDKFSEKGTDVKGIDIRTQVKNEVKTLSRLKGHPHIINLEDFYESSAFMFLVFELSKGGELFNYLTKEVTIPERDARRMMHQLLLAVKFMHRNDIVHRDLKPENILLDENHGIKVSDFGFATECKDTDKLFATMGTPAYFAPEVLKCIIVEGFEGYGKQVDLWACGVILYTLLVGQGPFWHRKETVMFRNILNGNYKLTSPEWSDISEGPKDLIRKLLVVEPTERLTVEQALMHPWFEGLVDGPAKRRRKISFKAFVYTVLSLKKLYYTFHERHQPQTFKTVIAEPYNCKVVRKLIDSCAFGMYGHWIKRMQDQAQNRAQLFESAPKREMMRNDVLDGTLEVPVMYSYELTKTFLPKRPSFLCPRKGSVDYSHNPDKRGLWTSSLNSPLSRSPTK